MEFEEIERRLTAQGRFELLNKLRSMRTKRSTSTIILVYLGEGNPDGPLPAQPLRFLQRQLSGRRDFKAVLQSLIDSGQIIQTGTGKKDDARMIRLPGAPNIERCPHCKGSGSLITFKQPSDDRPVF